MIPIIKEIVNSELRALTFFERIPLSKNRKIREDQEKREQLSRNQFKQELDDATELF